MCTEYCVLFVHFLFPRSAIETEGIERTHQLKQEDIVKAVPPAAGKNVRVVTYYYYFVLLKCRMF